MKTKRDWNVYMLRCKDGTLYTGITNNLEERIKTHNAVTGAKSITKSKRPVTLALKIGDLTKSEALKLEIEIKKLSRKEKLELIKSSQSS
ncbi:MAG: GIY-YIG nuclease family protein [Bacteroidales bacterium]|jgi:putative endonuclease|nr:GIY-YIG nuclease family protein [Bacteroidales bacterium]